jgi:hypothetical protein
VPPDTGDSKGGLVFEVKSLNGGVLITLREVVRRLGDPVAAYWSLKDIAFISRFPLDGDVFEFEERTRSPQGVIMSQEEFMNFISLDFQLADGTVYGFGCEPDGGFLEVSCVDSSFWEIDTDSAHILKLLKSR